MKKVLIMITLAALIFFPCSAHAENSSLTKLNRGVVNILTSPVEIPKQTKAYWHEGGKITTHISFWIFSGMVKGAVNTVTRAASGLWDVVTFPLEKPDNYESIIKPASVFDNWPTPENTTVERKN